MMRRLSMLLLASTLWIALPSGSFALDVNPPAMKDVAEATAFFNRLLETATNPVIAAMAKESLQKLSTPDTGKPQAAQLDAASKTVTEITLLPQNDSTFVVPAVINKKVMATFLVDTGASYTVITPQTAEALGIDMAGEHQSVPVTTANGTVNAPIVKLKNVTLGGILVNDVDAVVTDLGDAPQLSGLLGMSFFKGMEISFKPDRLVISR